MDIKSASFEGSFTSHDKCPGDNLPEFAFIGRSNVGKSSLINMLTNRKDLVKVSRTPGKTQTLNFFLINHQLHFVDLPGYGYAKVSHALRDAWSKMIHDYLKQRKTLYCVFVLIDSRVSPQKADLDFINRLGKWEVPFALVFTKSDKLSKNQVAQNIQSFLNALKEHWEKLPETFITSSITKAGKEELLGFMEHILRQTN